MALFGIATRAIALADAAEQHMRAMEMFKKMQWHGVQRYPRRCSSMVYHTTYIAFAFCDLLELMEE